MVAQLPADNKVSTYVRGDSSQSIGNAYEFVANAGQALQRRASSAQAANLPPAQVAAAKAQASAEINAFVSSTKSSYVDAMGWASIVAAIAAWLGAMIAFRFLPKRSETLAAAGRGPGAGPGGWGERRRGGSGAPRAAAH